MLEKLASTRPPDGSDGFRPENSIGWVVFNCHAADQHRALATGVLDAQCHPVFSRATDVKDELSVEGVGTEDSAASSPCCWLAEVIPIVLLP
jgi:hypothetical protein